MIDNTLNTPHQTEAPNIPYDRQVYQRRQLLLQVRSYFAGMFEQPLSFNNIHVCQCGSAGYGMT